MSETETIQSIADRLELSEYPLRLSKAIQEDARKAGIVIVYGASDDLMEFAGAIYDEVGVYDGGHAFVDSMGLVPCWETIDKDDKDAVRDCLNREGKGHKIEALWCAEGDYSWTYKTDLPHVTFEIREDGEPYCRGIIFELPKEGQ